MKSGEKAKNFPDQPYLKDERWKDAFKGEDFTETTILDSESQIKLQKELANGDYKKALEKNGEGEMAPYAIMEQDLSKNPMVRKLHNPGKGSLIVKASFNNEKGMYIYH